MKFRFKIQDYQTEAVNAVAKVFKGQPFCDMVRYTRDLGIRKRNYEGDALTSTSKEIASLVLG